MEKENRVPPHVMAELRKLMEGLDPAINKNERADIGIEACILNDVRHGPSILWALSTLGFKKEHIGARLGHGAGKNPSMFRWFKADDGFYALHD